MECLICHTKSLAFRDDRSKTIYYECSACQCVMKSPENFTDFSKQKERYDLHVNNENDPRYRAYFQRFMDFIDLDKRPQIESALDFGCGASTLLSNMLKEHNIPCRAYDPIYHRDEKYKELSYDLIVSVEVFEHLHDPRGLFGMLVGRLRSGGYIAIQTAFNLNDRASFLKWHYHMDPTHVVFFSPKTFEILADIFGVEIVKCDDKSMVLFYKS